MENNNEEPKMSYTIGDRVETVRNPQTCEAGLSSADWIPTVVEKTGIRFDGKPKVYVRIDGLLVSRQLDYIRK